MICPILCFAAFIYGIFSYSNNSHYYWENNCWDPKCLYPIYAYSLLFTVIPITYWISLRNEWRKYSDEARQFFNPSNQMPVEEVEISVKAPNSDHFITISDQN